MGKRKATVEPEVEAVSGEDEPSVDETAYYSIRCINGRAQHPLRSGLADPKEVKSELKVGLAAIAALPTQIPSLR